MTVLSRFLKLSFFLLIANLSLAQHPSISFTPGLATIAGETTKFIQDPSEYGFNYRIQVIHPIWDQQLNGTFEANYAYIPHKFTFSNGSYESKSLQTFWGIGLRYYLFDEIDEYNPYLGMVAPYVGLKIGWYSSKIRSVIRNNSTWEVPTEPQVAIAGRTTFGIAFGLSKRWMLDANMSITPDWQDGSDGIVGSSGFPDFYVSGGIGIQYDFGHLFEVTRH